MPVRMVFRCGYCDAVPDTVTQEGMQFAMANPVFGEFRDASPERWLVWYGKGLYGPARFACPDHRGDLVADLRETYGTVGWHPWKMGPYQPTWERRGNKPTPRRVGVPRPRAGWG